MISLKPKVWRIQRDQIYPDVVTCLTRDRRGAAFFKYDQAWEQRLLGRSTIYVNAFLSGTAEKPRLTILRETTEEQWK
jgi:hypothetical protein